MIRKANHKGRGQRAEGLVFSSLCPNPYALTPKPARGRA